MALSRVSRIVVSIALLATLSSAAAVEPSAAAIDVGEVCPAESVPANSFVDVGETNVHTASIDCAVWWTLLRGLDDSTFGPEQHLERGQVASILVRLVALTPVRLADSPTDWFTDDDQSVHGRAINDTAQMGLVQGTTPSVFEPTGAVTRGQVATLLVRAADHILESPLATGPDAFVDDEGSVHEAAIDTAVANGLVSGVSATVFRPNVPITRGQAASMVVRLLALLGDHGLVARPTAFDGAGTTCGPSPDGPRYEDTIEFSFRRDWPGALPNQRDVIRGAATRWQEVSAVRMQEVSDHPYDVGIAFTNIDERGHTLGVAIKGDQPTIAQAYLWFDDAEEWVDEWRADGGQPIDLYWVALHELGHVVGLGHSGYPGDIMYGCYNGSAPRDLTSSDRARAAALYHNSTAPPPPTPPTQPASAQITLVQGSAGPVGSWYSVSLSGFAPGSSVTLTCRDSVDPQGFYNQTFTINAAGQASDSTLCYSADGPDHWVTGGGSESNHVNWGGGSTPPPPPPPPAGPAMISLSQGVAAPSGSWYSVSLSGFAPGSSVTLTCRDSVDPQGFYNQTFTINAAGQASDSTLCYSADGPDHWVTGGGIESNHVNWGGGSTPPPPPPPPTPAPSIALARGAAAPAGYWYSVTLSGFSPGAAVTVTCRDSVDPQGFYNQTFTINAAGQASDSTLCYSADHPDHWVTGGGVESNHVTW